MIKYVFFVDWIHNILKIDDIELGFIYVVTSTIFVVRQIHEACMRNLFLMRKSKSIIYFFLSILEKAFDTLTEKVLL